jgi:3-oxoacyl-(acyl-carrier-protein) synthase
LNISITGLGLVTPLGGNCDETFDALLAGRFIQNSARAKFADDRQGGDINILALAAARQAISQAGWQTWPSDSAIVAGTSKGDVESWLTAIDKVQSARPRMSRAVLGPDPSEDAPQPRFRAADFRWGDRFGLGDLAATLAKNLGADRCLRLTYAAACASGLDALARAAMLIQFGEVRSALVVAAESSLHPLFRGCFQRLGVLSPPGEPCRPFDTDRGGFHISQAAAAVCVETGDTLREPIAQIDHAALAGDAWHLTGADPDGRTLGRLLQSAVAIQPPDLIHAHGTGTVANDAVELAAIESALPITRPPPILYSHKAALGHSLGASGLISVVINCLIHQRGQIPGNVCTDHSLPMEKLILPRCPTSRRIERSLALASGFGGAMAIVGLTGGPLAAGE